MRVSSVLFAILLTTTGVVSAEVAETFDVEAGRGTGVASNVAIAITGHADGFDTLGVWLATGRGASYSFDDGLSWFVSNTGGGLPAENLSAIYSINGRIWVASNHNELIEGTLMTLSNGLSYSDDNGQNWTTLDFSSDGLNIPYVIGGDRTIYDITGHHDVGFLNNRSNDTTDWLFASAFAGALLASQDGGDHWRRIFASRNDSIQYSYTTEAPSYRNRYFSCAADTSHGDSLFLWTGTAAGVFQYVFAPPRDKLSSRWINRITFCDTCSSGDGSRLFIAGGSGVSLASAAGGAINSRFAVDGLPEDGTNIVSVHSIGDQLMVGTVNPNTNGSTGMYVSSDGGESFSELITAPWSPGVGRNICDFTEIDGRVYAAVQTAGLYVSTDSGAFWSAVPIDSYFSQEALNNVYSLANYDNTLLVGTDSGLVRLSLDGAGAILSAVHEDFLESDTTSTRIARIRVQRFENATVPGTYDSTIVWTVNRPRTAVGRALVARRDPAGIWTFMRRGIDVYDVNFFSDTVFVMGETSIWFSPRGEEPTNFFSARQYSDTVVVDNLDNDTVTAMEVRGDTVIFGSSNGLALSLDRGETFRIYRANTDTLGADFVVNHSYITSLGGLAGDFIPALAVQYQPSGPARVWAGCRPAQYGYIGVSYGEYDLDGALVWNVVNEDDYAWNFEFMGDTIFVATNSGLLMNGGTLDSLNTAWTNVTFTDQGSGEALVAPGTSTYAVALVDTNLWVGTDGGTVRLSRDNIGNQDLYKHVDSTTSADEVYAFPVPFRPALGQTVDFHFTVEQAGNVTLEIYDFAMNLVATPIDNEQYAAGIYPPGNAQGVSWDGRNDKGDLVAVGVYYFKVEDGSGEARWGKLAVIP